MIEVLLSESRRWFFKYRANLKTRSFHEIWSRSLESTVGSFFSGPVQIVAFSRQFKNSKCRLLIAYSIFGFVVMPSRKYLKWVSTSLCRLTCENELEFIKFLETCSIVFPCKSSRIWSASGSTSRIILSMISRHDSLIRLLKIFSTMSCIGLTMWLRSSTTFCKRFALLAPRSTLSTTERPCSVKSWYISASLSIIVSVF
mmetsp:Transcript_55624/g.75929  ORF Transcript_55624/g.75929 Transcript_55624/m.75929 type:complete len:200 (-) Transcript_55624:1927-2526(-)